jgi:glycerophosphoryl diester phosphodiesterase
MAGVAKKVWDLTYAEIRAIPLGAKAAPEFRNEITPTFDEVLAASSNRIRLNIELKYYGDHQPRLAERVVQAVQDRGMTNQVIIQCLEYEPLLEVRRLAPGIPIGYLMSVNATHPGRLKVDFLGAELSRVTGAFLQAAHRRGQRVHVWTVDKPADMDRLIALGADDLITNKPAEASRRVRAYEELSQPERTLRRMHAWLAD